MRKKNMLITAIGMGVTYLMKNKAARDKLKNAVQSFTQKKR
ncbi:hypothetical protein [Paenibacillus sinopodophylli]|nr:hypothetical protein [Paenibacillus sinopodophylli]